jgi:O-antigen ligase
MYNESTRIMSVNKKRPITVNEILLYIYTLYITIVLFSYAGRINNRFILLITIMLCIEIVSRLFRKRKYGITENKNFIFIAIVFFISAIIAKVNGYSIAKSVQYIYCFFVFVLVSMSYQNEKAYYVLFKFLKLITAFFVLITMISAINPKLASYFVSLVYSYPDVIIEFANNGIFIGLAGEQSYNAYVISICLIIYFVDLFLLKSKKSVIQKAIYALGFISLVLTKKRSLILVVPTILMICIMLYGKRSKRVQKAIYFFFSLFIIAVFVNAIYPDVISLTDKMFINNSINLNYRDIIWGVAINKFLENPFFGVGINRFDIYFNQYYISNYSYYTYTSFAGAHNFYFQYLAELGTIGFICIIIIIYYELYKSIRYIKLLMGNKNIFLVRLILVSIGIQLLTLFYGLSGNTLHQYQQLFMYIIALGMSHYVGMRIKNTNL